MNRLVDALTGDHTYVESATWTPAGLPDTWVLGDSADIVRQWDYDPATLRLESIRAGTTQLSGTWNLVDLSYTWDDAGNVGSITDGLNDSQVQCFSYDTSNRLVGAFTGDDCGGYDSGVGAGPYTYSYTYTGIHNLATYQGAAYTYGTGNTSATGDAGPHAVVSVDSGAITFGYDNNGNRVTRVEDDDTTTYDYDDDNRLVTVTLDDLSTVTMGYDASGARVWRAHGTDSTRYIAGMVEEDLDTGTTTGYRSLYGFAGTAVAVVDHTADTVVYPVGDHLGSIVAAYNDTSNTVATMRYDPWGGERTATGALPTDHRYTGQTSDTTSAASGGTGLLFYNARHYDPAIGAFAQADTIIPDPTTPASFNRYAYVTNNPVNHTDPSGHVVKPGNHMVGDVIEDPMDNGCGDYEFTGSTVGCQPTSQPHRAGDLGDMFGLLIGIPVQGVADNFGMIASVGAFAACLAPAVGAAMCFVLQELAAGARAVDYLVDTDDTEGALVILTVGTIFNALGLGMSQNVAGAQQATVGLFGGLTDATGVTIVKGFLATLNFLFGLILRGVIRPRG